MRSEAVAPSPGAFLSFGTSLVIGLMQLPRSTYGLAIPSSARISISSPPSAPHRPRFHDRSRGVQEPVHHEVLGMMRKEVVVPAPSRSTVLEREHDIAQRPGPPCGARLRCDSGKGEHVGRLVLAAIAMIEILNGLVVAGARHTLSRDSYPENADATPPPHQPFQSGHPRPESTTSHPRFLESHIENKPTRRLCRRTGCACGSRRMPRH